jgi:hypothetical protein
MADACTWRPRRLLCGGEQRSNDGADGRQQRFRFDSLLLENRPPPPLTLLAGGRPIQTPAANPGEAKG